MLIIEITISDRLGIYVLLFFQQFCIFVDIQILAAGAIFLADVFFLNSLKLCAL